MFYLLNGFNYYYYLKKLIWSPPTKIYLFNIYHYYNNIYIVTINFLFGNIPLPFLFGKYYALDVDKLVNYIL